MTEPPRPPEGAVGDLGTWVRLAEIDAPERGQPWFERTKQALAARPAAPPGVGAILGM